MGDRLGYQVVFADSAVEFFIGLTKRRQRKLLDGAHALARDPFLPPNFRTRDPTGRDIAHVIVDGFIFDYWVDHAVKQVVVTVIDHLG